MIDLKKISKAYKLARNLTFQDLKVLLKVAKKRKYHPREVLIEQGTRNTEIFFIVKGLVRGYLFNEKGEDITVVLKREGQVVASPIVLLFDEPTRGAIVALEPTTTFSIKYEVLQQIVSHHPGLLQNQTNVYTHLLKTSIERVETLLLLTPEERYQQFVETHPELVNRVPGKYIAQTLGITPVSLSRIRKRISEKNLSP